MSLISLQFHLGYIRRRELSIRKEEAFKCQETDDNYDVTLGSSPHHINYSIIDKKKIKPKLERGLEGRSAHKNWAGVGRSLSSQSAGASSGKVDVVV